MTPEFSFTNNKAIATLRIACDSGLYGGGEVIGALLRNGQYIKLWNTDTGAYGVDGGKRFYQTHPWVMRAERMELLSEFYSTARGKLNYIQIPMR